MNEHERTLTIQQSREIQALLDHRGPTISLFVSYRDTHPPLPEHQVRLKKLYAVACEDAHRVFLPDAAQSLEIRLAELVANSDFWRGSQDGRWAVMTLERTALGTLPELERDHLRVSERPLLTPLLARPGTRRRYYALALSRGEVRLFECTRTTIQELALPDGAPTSVDEANGAGEPAVHSHSVGPTGRTDQRFHGQGGRADMRDAELRQFLLRLDDAVRTVLPRASDDLVLVGLPRIQAEFRAVCRLPGLCADGVYSEPGQLAPPAILEETNRVYERARVVVARDAGLHQMAERKKPVASTLEQTVRAAVEGRVEQLFVRRGATSEMVYDAGRHRLREANSTSTEVDAIETAIVETFRRGGLVWRVDPNALPPGAAARALLRYGVA